MRSYSTYYDVLGVASGAADTDIKAAFRKLALRHHPDKNSNSPESETLFKIIRHAYETLSDPATRAEYDAYLKTSSAFRGRPASTAAALPPVADGSEAFREIVWSRLNILLWDIEDFLRENADLDWNRVHAGRKMSQYLLAPLLFIDRWILDAAGFSDHFWDARGAKGMSRDDFFSDLWRRLSGDGRGWNIYVNVRDYFYDVRRRMNDFLNRARAADLLKPVSGAAVRIVDAVLEAQGLTVHHLCYLKDVLGGGTEPLAPFRYSHRGFDGTSAP
ncbi:MAG: J domain-containing protein [Spirochaetales bacterium]|nr:J domain-containing protein [Spirochaetales bacterium]